MYRHSIAKIEQGVREPTWTTAIALARALGVSVSEFDPGEKAK